MNRNADRRPLPARWWVLRVVLLFALFLSLKAAWALSEPGWPDLGAAAGLDSFASPDSLATIDSTLAPATSLQLLLDSLQQAKAAGSSPVDSAGWLKRFLRRTARWPQPYRYQDPAPRPMPNPRAVPDRPAEDLADALMPLTLGPLFDQGQLGHRQLLAIDGLQAGASVIRVDGMDLSSRITGLSDLNLLAYGLTAPAGNEYWNRLEDRPGGSLDFSTLRAQSDSILTHVRWADGFMGFISVDGDFQRPFLGGRLLLSTTQSFTHDRVPGAHHRGNLFQFNWDRPIGANWLLQVDQRLLRDANKVLDFSNSKQCLHQSVLRGRLTRLLSAKSTVGVDLWDREDLRDWDLGPVLEDHERIKGAALRLDRRLETGSYRLRTFIEGQQLSSAGWLQERTLFGAEGKYSWSRELASGRLVIEPSGQWHRYTAGDIGGWTAGTRLGLDRGFNWADLLLQVGTRPPTPEQLFLERDPNRMDAFVNPWLRQAALPLMPNPDLANARWRRQEARLGTTLMTERLPLVLRAWRVELDEDPIEAAMVGDTTWSWRGYDHVQMGVQLFARYRFSSVWSLRASQAWFYDTGNGNSREMPTYLLDGAVVHERLHFGGELRLRVTAGLHHEYGGVDSGGDALWELPEVWIQGEATRKRFTLWWALRNPFSMVENARVEDRVLHGHEEWLGLRWGFQD